MRLAVLVCITLITLAVRALASPPATNPSITLPDEIRKALMHNAEQIGPITLACTMQSSSTYTKEQAMEKLKLDDYLASFNAAARHEYRIEWQDGKYRSHFHSGKWTGMPEDHVPEQDLEGAFDGETIYLGDVRAGPNDPNLLPRGSVMFRIPLAITPTPQYTLENTGWTHGASYFDRIGMPLPVSIADLKSSSPPKSIILRMLDRGAKLDGVDEVDLDGRKCVRVRLIEADPDRKAAEKIDPDEWVERMKREGVAETEESLQAMANGMREQRKLPEFRVYLFYLDVQLNYALKRSEQRYDDDRDGVLLSRTDCEDFRPVAGSGLQLPRRCRESDYTSAYMPGKSFPEPTVTRTNEVTEIKLDPIAPERFILSYTAPGSEIIDILNADGGRREVTVQEDGTVRERGR